MKRLFIAFTLILAVLFTTGCVKREDVIFHGIENIDFSYKGNIKIDILTHIENNSGSNLVLKEVNFMLTDKLNNKLVELVVPENVIIPKHSDQLISIPVYAKINNVFAAIALAGEIAQNPNEIYIEGRGIVKAGLARKKVRLSRMTLNEFIEIMGGGRIEDYIDDFMDLI